MNGISYKLVRSRRRTVSLEVKNGLVTVRAGLNISKKSIEAFITLKREWIEKKLKQQSAGRNRFAEIISGKAYCLWGETFLNAHPEKSLKSFYIAAAKNSLEKMLTETAGRLGLTFAAFSLSNSKANWGSCNINNKITLNWRLVLLPERLAEYVIIHELCHTQYHNHSKNYWFFVEKHLKNYKVLKKEIKLYSPLMSVCRDKITKEKQ